MIAEYATLESRIRACMQGFAGNVCRQCPQVCCRPDICAETNDSIFLTRVRETRPPATSYSPQRGWLTPNGCALTVGRPPVCYAFFCDALMHSQSSDHNRDALRTLGRLLTNIGQNALGRRHLVEILDSDTLSRVNPNKIQTRLNDANSTLARIESTVLPVLTKWVDWGQPLKMEFTAYTSDSGTR